LKVLSKTGVVEDEVSQTIEQITEHYRIEKALASRLRNSSREERKRLYATLYDELFSRVPYHPCLTKSTSVRQRACARQMAILEPFLSRDTQFLEIGPGDCSLSFEVSKYVKRVVATDVTEVWIAKCEFRPQNFDFIISDGTSIDVPAGSINVAYSRDVMEHLHPDDAEVQLRNIYAALAPGGLYICMTPHRFIGPHDISRFFDEVPTGFHLKEYTYAELCSMLRAAGFSIMVAIVGYGRLHLTVPVGTLMLLEKRLRGLPKSIQRLIRRSLFMQFLLGMKIVARK
jgi:SAM-dependent methyltransferase